MTINRPTGKHADTVSNCKITDGKALYKCPVAITGKFSEIIEDGNNHHEDPNGQKTEKNHRQRHKDKEQTETDKHTERQLDGKQTDRQTDVMREQRIMKSGCRDREQRSDPCTVACSSKTPSIYYRCRAPVASSQLSHLTLFQ